MLLYTVPTPKSETELGSTAISLPSENNFSEPFENSVVWLRATGRKIPGCTTGSEAFGDTVSKGTLRSALAGPAGSRTKSFGIELRARWEASKVPSSDVPPAPESSSSFSRSSGQEINPYGRRRKNSCSRPGWLRRYHDEFSGSVSRVSS